MKRASPMVMHRSFADFMGFDWPPELAAIVNGEPVTWTEIGEQKRERQRTQLARKREVPEPHVLPCYVWTFHNDWVFPYGGWWCYVVTRRFELSVNPQQISQRFRGSERLALSIIQAEPLGLLPVVESFERWMVELARQRPRKHPSDPREAGVLFGWLKGRREFSLERPET